MNEKISNSIIVRSLKAQGLWAHKIADSPSWGAASTTRFSPSKPCDIITCYEGQCVLIETKLIKKWKPFGVKELRPSQLRALDEVGQASDGLALVFLHIKIPREVNGFLVFKFKQLKRWNRLSSAVLRDMKPIKVTKDGTGKEVFDIETILVRELYRPETDPITYF